jgi:hypothetical protein
MNVASQSVLESKMVMSLRQGLAVRNVREVVHEE